MVDLCRYPLQMLLRSQCQASGEYPQLSIADVDSRGMPKELLWNALSLGPLCTLLSGQASHNELREKDAYTFKDHIQGWESVELDLGAKPLG